MERYGELDKRLRQIHRMELLGSQEPDLDAEEATICAEMEQIDRTDHDQVESYRRAMGWKPCLDCQEKARHL